MIVEDKEILEVEQDQYAGRSCLIMILKIF